MAFGRHWEWRGFGQLGEGLRALIEAQPTAHANAQTLTDTYLWSPHSDVNVKLRMGDLKLKRLIERRDGLEEWLEDEEENYAFPLDEAQLRALEKALTIGRLDAGAQPVDRAMLLRSLKLAAPEVCVVDVEKKRQQYQIDGAAGVSEPVIVEIAEIVSPEPVTTVGVEHADAGAVAQVCEQFDLASALRPLNYLQAVASWARGRRLS